MASKETSNTGEGSSASAADKRSAQMAKLRALHLRRNEARKLNHTEVVEEDKRAKLPSNWEAKKRRVEWEEEEELKRKECEEAGEDFDRVKLLDLGATDAEKLARKKKKKNPDTGFSDFEQATFRQYTRLTKQMKPDHSNYDREKKKMGEAFYADVNTLGVVDHKDTEEGINRMVADLETQIEKRSKYSRRRTFDEDEGIDYINERNMKFNKKLERFYGQYTAEIKQNLERGTAV